MRTKYFKLTSLLIALALLLSKFTITAEAVGAAPSLGTVSTYGLLGTTTTVTGQTIIKGDLGSGGATATATVNGATNVANGAYTAAKIDLDAAITAAAAQPADFNRVQRKSAITLGADSVTNGRILAQTAVTANAANTQINVPSCAATVTPTPTPSMTSIPSSTPAPSTT